MYALDVLNRWSMTMSAKLSPLAPLIMEFFGTYFLVTSVYFANSYNGGGPLAVALMLVAMVFMGGHISGGFYNPAVTFAVFCSGRDRMKPQTLVSYIAVQVGASLLASLVCWAVDDDVMVFSHVGVEGGPFYTPEIMPNGNAWQAFLCEFLATFALSNVVLAVGTSKKIDGNSFYGLAIGFTVGAFAYAFGSISGGVFNPAVGTGPLVANALEVGSWRQLQWLWLYWLAPMFGGFVASITYRVTHFDSEYFNESPGDEQLRLASDF